MLDRDRAVKNSTFGVIIGVVSAIVVIVVALIFYDPSTQYHKIAAYTIYPTDKTFSKKIGFATVRVGSSFNQSKVGPRMLSPAQSPVKVVARTI